MLSYSSCLFIYVIFLQQLITNFGSSVYKFVNGCYENNGLNIFWSFSSNWDISIRQMEYNWRVSIIVHPR